MKASASNAVSVGFPADGMGVKGYPSKEVFNTFLKAVQEFSQASPA